MEFGCEDDQKAFKEKVEAAGKLKQAGLTLLKEEVDRLWEMESEKLMEELGVTVGDLDPKPTDAQSKNKALKDLKKKRAKEEKEQGTFFGGGKKEAHREAPPGNDSQPYREGGTNCGGPGYPDWTFSMVAMPMLPTIM